MLNWTSVLTRCVKSTDNFLEYLNAEQTNEGHGKGEAAYEKSSVRVLRSRKRFSSSIQLELSGSGGS